MVSCNTIQVVRVEGVDDQGDSIDIRTNKNPRGGCWAVFAEINSAGVVVNFERWPPNHSLSRRQSEMPSVRV